MRFSIIVPVFNVAPYLRVGLESIRSQTFRDWECICVDDGSNDGCGTLLDEYAAHDDRFVVLHKPNGGVSSARNAGLDVVRGEWVIFFDPDDAIVPGTLDYLDGRIRMSPDVDIFGFGYEEVAKQDVEYEFHERPFTRYLLNGEKFAGESYVRLFCKFGACGACFRRLAMGSARFEPLTQAEDVLFGMECLLHARVVERTETVLYLYFRREGSCTNTLSLARFTSILKFGALLSEKASHWIYFGEIRKYLAKVVWHGFARNIAGMRTIVPEGDMESAWDFVFDYGRDVFSRHYLYSPVERIWNRLVFALGSRAVVRFAFCVPLRIKSEMRQILMSSVRYLSGERR